MTRIAHDSPSGSTAGGERGAWVQLNDICMRYGDGEPAVEQVSLDVRPGQFVTLLGASGSGKTTLLRIIAGFLTATSGQVVLDNREISRVPVHRRNIGMVFQNYALFPHMSVARNVAFPLAMAKVPRRDRDALVREALAKVHLESFAHRMPSELSGGQQQRAALARAIVARPRLLLMDEPLGALDRRLREDLQIEMLRLSRELGLTVINVTHDQEEALTMSDRIALLIDGRLAQYGAPSELYGAPVSEAVATFLGESNIFRGTLVRIDGRLHLDVAHGRVLASSAGAAKDVAPAVGAPAAVMVRPGHVSVVDSPPSDPDLCWIPARAAATIFAGDSQKVLLESPDGQKLVVRRPADRPAVPHGADVVLAWPGAAAVNLPSA